MAAAKKVAQKASAKVVEVASEVDAGFAWASNVKRAWMFVLGALVIGFVAGAALV
jgi:uncharacterized protein YhjY with autotransporter beta-barrel domain